MRNQMQIRRGVSLTSLLVLLTAFALSPLAVLAQDSTPGAGGEIPTYEAPQNVGEIEGTIEVDGSSTVGPITEAVAEEFADVAENVGVTVGISGTGGGFERFCTGETDISDASRPISQDETLKCAENGIEYYQLTVAIDGITIVVNPENEFLECISVDSLAAIWGPDPEITNWNQVNPDFPDQPITLYGPGPDSGTFDFFTEAIVGEEGASRTDYTASEDDNVLVQGVAGDPNGLGYFGYAYYEENQDVLRAVAVSESGDLTDCVEPSPETIGDYSYTPLSRPIFIYVKAESLERPEVQEFVKFYLMTVNDLIADVGYVRLPADTILEDLDKIDAAIAGEGRPDSAATPGA